MPNTREKLIELIQSAVDGCATYWAGLIADYLIAHGVTVQKWIPVTERLPEYGQEVIAYSGNVLKPKVFAYQYWVGDYASWSPVSHWMPLPQPPKGE